MAINSFKSKLYNFFNSLLARISPKNKITIKN